MSKYLYLSPHGLQKRSFLQVSKCIFSIIVFTRTAVIGTFTFINIDWLILFRLNSNVHGFAHKSLIAIRDFVLRVSVCLRVLQWLSKHNSKGSTELKEPTTDVTPNRQHIPKLKKRVAQKNPSNELTSPSFYGFICLMSPQLQIMLHATTVLEQDSFLKSLV